MANEFICKYYDFYHDINSINIVLLQNKIYGLEHILWVRFFKDTESILDIQNDQEKMMKYYSTKI